MLLLLAMLGGCPAHTETLSVAGRPGEHVLVEVPIRAGRAAATFGIVVQDGDGALASAATIGTVNAMHRVAAEVGGEEARRQIPLGSGPGYNRVVWRQDGRLHILTTQGGISVHVALNDDQEAAMFAALDRVKASILGAKWSEE